MSTSEHIAHTIKYPACGGTNILSGFYFLLPRTNRLTVGTFLFWSRIILMIVHWSFSKGFVDLKLIGANAGLSMAAESAICNRSSSVDCLSGGRSNTTTPSTRPRAASLRELITYF
jgi:hypothetical protein